MTIRAAHQAEMNPQTRPARGEWSSSSRDPNTEISPKQRCVSQTYPAQVQNTCRVSSFSLAVSSRQPSVPGIATLPATRKRWPMPARMIRVRMGVSFLGEAEVESVAPCVGASFP